MERFRNRADTVSRLASPLGIWPVLRSRVVGGGWWAVGVGGERGERATEESALVYFEI